MSQKLVAEKVFSGRPDGIYARYSLPNKHLNLAQLRCNHFWFMSLDSDD
jgi:hypothetical protein